MLDGVVVTNNTDNTTYTNYTLRFGDQLPQQHHGQQRCARFVGAERFPTNSPLITLATSSAVPDAANMGYVSNFTDVNGANAILVTNGTFTVAAATPNGTPQVLAGFWHGERQRV